MYKRIGDINKHTQEAIRSDYQKNGFPTTNILKKYHLLRPELLAVLGDEAKITSFPGGKIKDDVFIALSDTHLGSAYAKLSYYDYLCEYVTKYNIHDIVHAGDFVEGEANHPKLLNVEAEKQVEYALNIMPKLKSVTTHILLGNHDLKLLDTNREYMKMLKSRDDFNILGFKKAYLAWGKYLFSVNHRIKDYHFEIPEVKVSFQLFGHRHALKINEDNNDIYLPCFCLRSIDDANLATPPGFVVAKKEGPNMSFYYFAFEENIKCNSPLAKIKKVAEVNTKPLEYGKVLEVKGTPYRGK